MSKNKQTSGALSSLIKNSLRLSKIIWKEKKGAVVAMLFVYTFLSFAPFVESGLRGLLINELIRIPGVGQISPNIILITAAFIFISFLRPAISSIQYYLSRLFFFFTGEKFELLIIKKKGEIDVATHEDPKQNDLFNKITENGVWRAQNFIDRGFYIFQNTIEVVVASFILVFSQWWVLPAILVAAIPEFITEAKYGKEVWGIHNTQAEIRRRFWDVHRHFNWLPALTELKIFQNTVHFFSIIKELFKSFQTKEKRSERKKLFYRLISVSLSQIVMGLAITWFIYQVIQGRLLVGTLTFILASLGDLRQALSGLFSNLGRQYQDSLFVTDVFKFADIKPAIKKPEKGIIVDREKTPEIIFDNVAFSYPGTNKEVLKNFSLKISPGEKVAIVGVNGAGKTTFVKLLARFYDADKGRITINGHNIKDIDIESWYSTLGVLFQQYAQYHFLVKEAIAVGRTSAGTSLEKVKEAAKASEADIFIEEWEKNYNQMLGKEFSEGIEPSIGQWQKLALARTFYRDPRILILDEPTSSIDAESEAKIFEKLESLPRDRTVILISHRFSTVRHADKIVVIEDGLIKESGSHEELLKLNGSYAYLFNLQAKGYK